MLKTWKNYNPKLLKQEQAKLLQELRGKKGTDSEEIQLKFKKLYNILICRAYGAMDFLDNHANEEELKQFGGVYKEILDLIEEVDLQLLDKREGYVANGFQEASIKRECSI